MIDGTLHVYYVVEDDGRCEYIVSDESNRTEAYMQGRTTVPKLRDVMSNAVHHVMTEIMKRSGHAPTE